MTKDSMRPMSELVSGETSALLTKKRHDQDILAASTRAWPTKLIAY